MDQGFPWAWGGHVGHPTPIRVQFFSPPPPPIKTNAPWGGPPLKNKALNLKNTPPPPHPIEK